jgi:hypothetical protein
MNVVEHLTKNQLAGYSTGTLSETEARAAGRHLLQCEACRKLMPMPSPERFMSVLMTENDLVAAGTTTTTAAAEKTVASTRRSLSAYFAVFNSPAGFAWSAGGALVLILTVTAFLWIYADRQQTTSGGDNGEIAQINPAEREVINPPVFIPSPVSIGSSNLGIGDHPSKSTGNDNSFRVVNGVKEAQHKEKPLRETERDSQPDKRLNNKIDRSLTGSNSGSNKVVVSTSRSLNDCPQGSPEIVLSPYFETVTEKQPVLRWKAVPGAVQYELYVSDSEQMMVEKGEVKDDTSFRLKKELEANKSYKWKVIALLSENKRLSSDSISFSVGGAARKYSPKKIGQMKINPTRCIQETTKSEP